MTSKTRIWDLPTRLFHWALAACVLGLLATGYLGIMEWHFRLGFSVLILLLFRLVWGLVGGRWSRFSSFLYSPGTLAAYLRGQGKLEHSAGHSPTGALSVFGLLGILALQVATGLVSDDEISYSGPLSKFVSNASVSLATGYHKNFGQWIVLALVVLHVLAIGYYLLKKKQNLTTAMVTGDKALGGDVPASRDTWQTRLLALVVLGLCVSLVGWMLKAAG